MAPRGSQAFAPKRSHNAFSAKLLPIILVVFTLLILFVLFRMKRVEQDYAYFDLKRDIEKESQLNKELKAVRAELLSVRNLNVLAKKLDLNRPREEQVIIIP